MRETGVDTAKPAQTTSGTAHLAEQGNLNPVMIPNKNKLHLARPMNNEAYLPVQFRGQQGCGTG